MKSASAIPSERTAAASRPSRAPRESAARRVLLLVHRYTAVAVGVLVALWCLSGFVMMYQSYPAFTRAERLRGLEPVTWDGCCATAFLNDDDVPPGNFHVEMLRGVPVLRRPGSVPVDLRTGDAVTELSTRQLLDVAATHARGQGLDAHPQLRGVLALDQWTIQTAPRNQPAHRVALGDAAGTELYVNGATGEIFQDTNRRERVLSWFGAIPHWLYPTVLRRNQAMWSQVVIVTSGIGVFLAATGLYAGVIRWRRGRASRVSPYRGWWYWHHVLGLVFGVLALTWLFSGLMTMNPAGVFDGGGAGERALRALHGEASVAQLRQFLDAAPARLAGESFVRFEAGVMGGTLAVTALRADGSARRLSAAAVPQPLDSAEVERALRGIGVRDFTWLDSGDDYYYRHKEPVELPAYRAILDDPDRTRLYVGATTGATRAIDRGGRRGRWLERALHGLDFRALRRRPLWDVVMLLLLAGVTALAVTGAWMALKRVRADLAPRPRS
jgi:hypothetical protein